ncbi:GNAT family N-acetyltransferase [Alteraurantiacibacter aquimixticola]|uniref:N-acetyltransferase n=1 Tax=Alteraurantiacibacter aquimixticola TaxID=2489173 RepID=A0A4T3F1R6_9SPHN|nr:N-acetyltransferase [Alteraurantiacibacter aquimixticola]TIX51028.1 N-acetyltransferase [Alteraurantiacibacter aquimixticola]
MAKLVFRRAQRPGDDDALWAILEPVVREGTTYPVDPGASREEVFFYWFAPDKRVWVAEDADGIIGTYYLKPNSTGPAAHVANAGYMVLPAARGRGIARAMAEHSFAQAKLEGFRAMQFNLVIATNAAALHLWRSVGMEEIGRLPQAFRLPSGDYVDALVMYRLL